MDGDLAALTVTADPYPLNIAGEVAALRAGRRTYQLFRGALDPRDRWNIPGHPPTADLTVLAEHRCRDLIPAGWRRPPTPKVIHRPTESEEIPF